MRTKVETLTVEELRMRLVFVPLWIRVVMDRATAEGRMVEYEYLVTAFGTYPQAVRVAEDRAAVTNNGETHS